MIPTAFFALGFLVGTALYHHAIRAWLAVCEAKREVPEGMTEYFRDLADRLLIQLEQADGEIKRLRRRVAAYRGHRNRKRAAA